MAVYLIARGIGYHREGIDDIGDIYEIFDGPAPPGGTGYELADIITVEVLSREEVETVLNTIRPTIIYDELTDKEYWLNPKDDKWYEIKIKSKYELTIIDLTGADRVTLVDENSTSLEQITALGKIKANINKYSENTQTLKPNI